MAQSMVNPPNAIAEKISACDSIVAESTKNNLEINSFHIKEEPASFRNKTGKFHFLNAFYTIFNNIFVLKCSSGCREASNQQH